MLKIEIIIAKTSKITPAAEAMPRFKFSKASL
jgi:hypothetical protein